ncbi:MAG TPA: hypothetical protein VNZ22_08390, partial [Bacillota bacterium]|nr:hypothetical protein [Bacillota bacterium]
MDANLPLPPASTPPPPPLAPPPPLMTPPSPPPPPRRGRGWMILALVLLVLLLFSVLGNLSNFASSLTHSKSTKYTRTIGPKLDEVIREDNDAANKIAVVQVDGIITGSMLEQGGVSMVELIRT